MSTRTRVAITVAYGLALGFTALGFHRGAGNFDPGIWRVGAGALTVYGLAAVGAFLVDRWWALLPSISTAGVLWVTAELGHPGPWSSDPAVPSFIWPLILFQTIAPYAGLLLAGVLARRLWDRCSHSELSAAIAKGE